MSYKKVLITSINPSSYCESYKRVLIQSSNPIQFLDPTKFQTLTVSGVSFVSSNGVITANGTATANVWFAVQTLKMDVLASHKMLITGCPSGGSWDGYCLYDSGDSTHGVEFGSGKIYTINESRSTYIYIFIKKGYTVTNLQFKPRFYDLTATFGVGNEPTTVAAFRAKFPNEVYPYNPSYCFSPQSALITPTKNLFNPASANIIDHTTYFNPAVTHTGHFYKMAVEAGATYSVSYDLYYRTSSNALALSVQTGNYYKDGTQLLIHLTGKESMIEFYRHTGKFKVPDGITEVTFSALADCQYRNFQIEKGTTTTSYVPYNYI